MCLVVFQVSSPGVSEELYEAARRVLICLDALTDLLLTPAEEDPQLRLLQQEVRAYHCTKEHKYSIGIGLTYLHYGGSAIFKIYCVENIGQTDFHLILGSNQNIYFLFRQMLICKQVKPDNYLLTFSMFFISYIVCINRAGDSV